MNDSNLYERDSEATVLTVSAHDSGVRLDKFLSEACSITRAAAVRLLEAGCVTMESGAGNNRRSFTPDKNTKLKAGDTLTVIIPEPEDYDVAPEDIPLDVIYEDGDIIVINKPVGMVVHPAPGNYTGTLVNALLFRCGDSLSGVGGVKRPGIVHRIDKDTSGLLVVAKNDDAHNALSAQLKTHTVSRVYHAVCIGNLKEDKETLYNTFPFTIMEMFKGGFGDWGTICGALAGAGAAFSVFFGRKESKPMVNELFRWYEATAFPIYNPGEAAQGFKGDLPTSVANSVLCHVSVSRWSYETKIPANSKQRSERCGRITADVAKKAIEILNAKLEAGKDWKGALAKQESVTQCGACHSKGKMSDIVKGNMDCTPCHSGNEHLGNKFVNHP